jgi:site-specific DNA-methyltransferase (adenine-specific)
MDKLSFSSSDAVLFQGDCLEELLRVNDCSVNMILCDLPYGTTKRNKWDVKIPLEPLWEQFVRVLKSGGVVALWSQMPFSAELVMSKPDMFRYEWIVEKTSSTGFLNARKMPLKAHESVLIFYNSLPVYNPQKTTGHKPVNSYTKHVDNGTNYGSSMIGISGGGNTDRFPRDVIKFKWDTQKSKLHPTQKPVAANEYFIKTYTNEGDTVLDCCMGSGSTGVAALSTDRRFIGIELDVGYFNIAKERIEQCQN